MHLFQFSRNEKFQKMHLSCCRSSRVSHCFQPSLSVVSVRKATTVCHYHVLGCRPDAKPEDIKRAYLTMAKKWHPDVNGADDATSRFAQINSAYSTLSNVSSRAQYDSQTGVRMSSTRYSYYSPPKDSRANSHSDSHANSQSNQWWDFDTHFGADSRRKQQSSAESRRRQESGSAADFGFDFNAFEDIYSRLHEKYGDSDYYYATDTGYHSQRGKGYYSTTDSYKQRHNGRKASKATWFDIEDSDEDLDSDSDDDLDDFVDSGPRHSRRPKRRRMKPDSTTKNGAKPQSQSKAETSASDKTEGSDATADSKEEEDEYFEQFNEDAFWRFIRNSGHKPHPSANGKKQKRNAKNPKNSGSKTSTASHSQMKNGHNANQQNGSSQSSQRKEHSQTKSTSQKKKAKAKQSSSKTAEKTQKSAKAKGFNIEKNVSLEFMESVLGCKQSVSYSREEVCGKCLGSGLMGFTDPNCSRAIGGHARCHCDECGGGGQVTVRKEVTVSLPCGLRKGDRIRVAQCGHFGKGDLWLCVEWIKAHSLFVRRNDDIHVAMHIPYALAILGGTLTVPTIYGPAVVRTQGLHRSNYSLIKGKGVLDATSQKRGVQYVHFQMAMPDANALTEAQRQALATLAKVDNEPIVARPGKFTVGRHRKHFHSVGKKFDSDTTTYGSEASDETEEASEQQSDDAESDDEFDLEEDCIGC